MHATGVINGVSDHRLLSLAGALIAACSAAAQTPVAPPPPDSYTLSGIVRDFASGHPDFDVIPADGYGYYAGNVAYDLDAEGKPVYTGEGFRLGSLWKDANGNPIAPHLYNTCDFVGPPSDPDPPPPPPSGETSNYLTVDKRLWVDRYSVIDSFDSNVGPYDEESNSGSAAMVRVNGNTDYRYHVKLAKRSIIMGDLMLNPDADPDRVVRMQRGAEVTGTIGHLETLVDVPSVEMPDLDPGERGRRMKFRGGTHDISEDLHCKYLKAYRRATVRVEGDVTIYCDDSLSLDDRSVLEINGHATIYCGKDLDLDDKSEIRLGPDASVDLYVGRRVYVDDGSKINMNTGDPQLVSLNMLHDTDDDDDKRHRHHYHHRHHRSRSRISIDDRSQVAAWVHGAATKMELDDGSELFGSFLGEEVRVNDRSRLHVDMATATETTTEVLAGAVVMPEECDLGDVEGTFGVPSGQDVTSAGTFAEWWRDVLGVNLSGVHAITFTRDAGGVYRFIDDDFRPIDGQLLGNEGDNHNYHFTYEVAGSFAYDASADQYVEFRGTDDAYVFVNGRLVLDLGGYGYNKVQRVHMDRLGLEDGQVCTLQFFHAQRQRGLGIFRLSTNIVLVADATATPSISSILED